MPFENPHELLVDRRWNARRDLRLEVDRTVDAGSIASFLDALFALRAHVRFCRARCTQPRRRQGRMAGALHRRRNRRVDRLEIQATLGRHSLRYGRILDAAPDLIASPSTFSPSTFSPTIPIRINQVRYGTRRSTLFDVSQTKT